MVDERADTLGRWSPTSRTAHPSRASLWVVQALLGFSLADLIGYATHRVFHRERWMWPFHAVHHSSETLDWLAATRVHPVNELVSKLALTLPLLGFKTTVFASA